MAQRVIAYDDVEERLVRTTKDPADILSGSSTGGAIPDEVAAGSETITNGVTSISVTFTNDLSSLSYAVVLNFTNTTDSLTLFQPTSVTSKTVSGFTAEWNSPVDSGNYILDYIAVIPCSSFRSDSFDISNATDNTGTKNFLSVNTFAFCGQFLHTTGALFFSPALTTKNTTQYVASWNIDTDDAGYDLDYNALSAACPSLKSGVEAVSNGATSLAVSYPFPALSSGTYALLARFSNTTDSEIIYQPITVTAKSLSGFTATWNNPVDSGDYNLEWILHITN
jgi:hypothetical protein